MTDAPADLVELTDADLAASLSYVLGQIIRDAQKPRAVAKAASVVEADRQRAEAAKRVVAHLRLCGHRVFRPPVEPRAGSGQYDGAPRT